MRDPVNGLDCERVSDLAYDSDTGESFGYGHVCTGGNDGLYLINTRTAQMTFVGPSGFPGSEAGIAVHADGTIYGVLNVIEGLVTINRDTGEATPVPGTLGNVPNGIKAVDFNKEYGLLMAFFTDEANILGGGPGQTHIVSIDLETGDLTSVHKVSIAVTAVVFDEEFEPVSVPATSSVGLILLSLILLLASATILRRRRSNATGNI